VARREEAVGFRAGEEIRERVRWGIPCLRRDMRKSDVGNFLHPSTEGVLCVCCCACYGLLLPATVLLWVCADWVGVE
jgi:hypothetical protein